MTRSKDYSLLLEVMEAVAACYSRATGVCLGAAAYERAASRRGYAKGYKPKTVDP